MKASLHNYRHAPRKVRLITDAVKGKRVSNALIELTHAKKKGADQIKKLVASAAANAKQLDSSLTPETLFIENITVDQGLTMRRFMPRARGRAAPINRESSHVHVTLGKAGVKGAKVSAEKAVSEESEEKVAKKAPAKKAPKKKAASAK